MKDNCIFCGNTAECKRNTSKGIRTYTCVNHGSYTVHDDVTVSDTDKILLSGFLFENRLLKKDATDLTATNIREILAMQAIPNTAMQKLNKIILYCYGLNKGFSTVFENIPAYVGYAESAFEMEQMLSTLCEMDYIKSIEQGKYMLTFKGLQYAEKIKTAESDSNKVFVAIEFSDNLLSAHNNAIKPACRACGFDAFIVLEKEHNNNITDEIITGIKSSKFVIADLTYNNHGVYFEAGYAQGMGLDVIRTCNKDWFKAKDYKGNILHKLHFDVQNYNFILWEDEADLKAKLVSRIRAMF